MTHWFSFFVAIRIASIMELGDQLQLFEKGSCRLFSQSRIVLGSMPGSRSSCFWVSPRAPRVALRRGKEAPDAKGA
jgi:hypothetical protein